jgi:hypothetical protein
MFRKKEYKNQVRKEWYTHLKSLLLGKQRQEDPKFEAGPGKVRKTTISTNKMPVFSTM